MLNKIFGHFTNRLIIVLCALCASFLIIRSENFLPGPIAQFTIFTINITWIGWMLAAWFEDRSLEAVAEKQELESQKNID